MPENQLDSIVQQVGPVAVSNYKTFLNEAYRPPSRGGNTRAWHQHSFEVDGQRYSFLALGTKKWIFKTDTVQFSWQWDAGGKYRNVIPESITTYNRTKVLGSLVAITESKRNEQRRRECQLPNANSATDLVPRFA